MNQSMVCNINPKGDVFYYDKNRTLRSDLNIYQLSEQDQVNMFGKIMSYDKGSNKKEKLSDTDLISEKDLMRKLGYKGTWEERLTEKFKKIFKRK